jgi:uncharacterized membrane protein
VIHAALGYERIVDGAFDKIRQAGSGMPAVVIRQLEALARIVSYTTTDQQQVVLTKQAEMLLRATDAIPEPNDRQDVRDRYASFVRAAAAVATTSDRWQGSDAAP